MLVKCKTCDNTFEVSEGSILRACCTECAVPSIKNKPTPPIPFDKFLQQYKEDPAGAMAMLQQTDGKTNMAVFPIEDVLKCITPTIKPNQDDRFDYVDPNIKSNTISKSEYRQDMSALEFADTSHWDGKRMVVVPHNKPTAKRLEQLVNDRIKEKELHMDNKWVIKEKPLPEILLKVNGYVFAAGSESGEDIQWSIYSEAEDYSRARTKIRVDNKLIADITIHNMTGSFNKTLPEEVQAVSSAIVWSGIRSVRLKRNAVIHTAPSVITPVAAVAVKDNNKLYRDALIEAIGKEATRLTLGYVAYISDSFIRIIDGQAEFEFVPTEDILNQLKSLSVDDDSSYGKAITIMTGK